jgi:hypothetical protein
VQCLNEDDFARAYIAPPRGVQRSSFFEAINTRGLHQLQFIFQELYCLSGKSLPSRYTEFGDVRLVDGSLIDSVFSMEWADYRKKSRKAKGHFSFDLNKGIPAAVYLTDGKGAERPFASLMLSTNQTGVFDRGYQEHQLFDSLDQEGKFFVCRIRKNTNIECISESIVNTDDYILYDKMAYIGTFGVNQTKKPFRVVAYQIGNTKYIVVTNRMDLTAEQIAFLYKLRWDIEKFFQWWKKHLNIYHLIGRSKYAVMIQILAGLITYLLLTIYCRKHYNEHVSLKKFRTLQNDIQNEIRISCAQTFLTLFFFLLKNYNP